MSRRLGGWVDRRLVAGCVDNKVVEWVDVSVVGFFSATSRWLISEKWDGMLVGMIGRSG